MNDDVAFFLVKGLGTLIGYGLCGLIGLMWNLRNLWLSFRCKFWKIVDGEIKDSSVETRQYRFKSYYPIISYTYNVDGVVYEGSKIKYGGTGGSKSVADDYFEKYPVGKKVKVSIDPNDYSKSVLEPGASLNTIVWIIIFFGLALMGYRALLAYLQTSP